MEIKNTILISCSYSFWKSIKGYEGHYEISPLGTIRSLKHGRKRILKQSKSVILCKNGNEKHFNINNLRKKHIMTKTKSILLNVPADLYFRIKDQAELESRASETKITIHDKMLRVLDFGAKALKL